MMTKEQAQRLAALVHSLRSDWDEPGVMSQLLKVRTGDPFNIALATIRAAANPKATTPGVIAVTTGEHWREKVTPSEAPRPPRVDEACSTCGMHLDKCLGGHESTTRPARTDRVPPTSTFQQARAAMRGGGEEA